MDFFSSGFNDLKSELTDYLKKFAENGKVRGKDLWYVCVDTTVTYIKFELYCKKFEVTDHYIIEVFFMKNISIFLRLSKRKTSESSFLEWRQGNARGLRDQCSLCVNNGKKLTSHTFQRFLTILCTFQEEMSKLCSVWFFFF